MDSDEAILPAVAAGDPGAFGRWIGVAERPIRLSLRSFASRVDVEAVVQETLLRVWQIAPRVSPDGRPNPLLRVALRVARNVAIDEVRRAQTFVARDADFDGNDSPAAMDEPDPLLRKTIRECRDKLPAKPRLALESRITSEGARPDAVLAASLGMKLNTFLQNVTRARKLLADCLHSRGVESRAIP